MPLLGSQQGNTFGAVTGAQPAAMGQSVHNWQGFGTQAPLSTPRTKAPNPVAHAAAPQVPTADLAGLQQVAQKAAQMLHKLGIPVVANGDIYSLEALRRCQDETDCQHFMLGRGSLAAPGLALEAAHELRIPGATRPTAFDRTPGQWLPLVQRFVEIATAMGKPPEYAVSRVKKWLRLANLDGCMGWIDALNRQQSLPELLNGLDDAARQRDAVLQAS